MKKNGFTVIEAIVCISIILIIFSYAASNRNLAKNIYKDIESEGFMYEVHNFLTYAKLRSMNEGKRRKIMVTPSENKIYFKLSSSEKMNSSNVIESISVPDGMSIESSRTSYVISWGGRINNSGKIIFKDYLNDLKYVAIRVGVDYINLNGKQ